MTEIALDPKPANVPRRLNRVNRRHTMRTRHTLLNLPAALAVILGGELATADERESREVNYAYDASAAKLIEIDIYAGEVRLEQGDTNEVRVTGKLELVRQHTKAQEELAKIEPKVETGESFTLTLAKGSGPRYAVDITITVPRGVPLDVYLQYGEMNVIVTPPNDATFALRAGELDINVPRETVADVVASAAFGEVSLSGFGEEDGDAPRKLLVGAKYAGHVGSASEGGAPKLTATVTFGEVSIDAVEPAG